MLSGIQVGKKKKATKGPNSVERGAIGADSTHGCSHRTAPSDSNAAAAAALREALMSTSTRIEAANPPLPPEPLHSGLKTAKMVATSPPLVTSPPLAAYASAPLFRDHKPEADMSVDELVAMEKQQRHEHEREMKNILRLNKKRKIKASVDSDDDDDAQIQSALQASAFASVAAAASRQPERVHFEKQQWRDYQRQTHASSSSPCWWHFESMPAHHKFRVVALGNHVVLVMAPSHETLAATVGQHLYLVPQSPVASLSTCHDPEICKEIEQFQASLSQVFPASDLIYFETVLPSHLSDKTSFVWQTKLEAVAVPRRAASEAPMVFRQALTEQADETHGVHQKLLTITAAQPVHRVVPARYPYFYVQWSSTKVSESTPTGYAQLIESFSFPRDFGLDTIAGMLREDELVRFRRRRCQNDERDRQEILQFLTKWKPHDWTLTLDEDEAGA
jgi:Protein similar to CwfJ C-terminus 2/Protein similar to CwfJ C-terminus 1